jgi:hypothetical protein
MASSELLTPHPLTTQRVCPPPAPKGGGGTHSPGGGGWGVNSSEAARHWIGLLQYNPLRCQPEKFASGRILRESVLRIQAAEDCAEFLHQNRHLLQAFSQILDILWEGCATGGLCRAWAT